MAENYIIEDGLDKYYVADLEVTEKTEQMVNIRTLAAFLQDKAPLHLAHLKKMIALEREIV